MWFWNPLSSRAFWLKFAALTRKRRKRLYDVENFTNKIVRMRLLTSFWEPRDQPQPGFFLEAREKTLGTKLFLRDLPIEFVKYFED